MRTSIITKTLIACLVFLSSTEVNAQHYRGYRTGYRYYGYHHYYSAPRVRISYFSNPYRIIPFGGASYYYSNGYFYRPYGSYFNLIIPPVGIHLNVLPSGYRTFYYGGEPYYYYNGIFYDRHNDYYEVINAPIGAQLPELPGGARVVVINNEKFYELNGTYYKETIKDNGEIWYTVTGKHGVLNTDQDEESNNPDYKDNNSNSHSTTEIGDIADELPENTKVVVINKQKLYLAPDGTYYSEVIENNEVHYKVVGK